MATFSKMVKPTAPGLVRLQVIARERLSPHWMRITVGGGEIDRFVPMGYDQWFRLFLPLGGDEGIDRLPAKASSLIGYLKYLRIPDGVRPVMRNYTVRAYRAADAATGVGAQIDIDFVVHGSEADGTAGPASRWALACEPGDTVVILDEGLAFNPERGVDRVLLVADETGLPAVAGICASLPADATGRVVVEVPSGEDRLEFARPDGVDVSWIVRDDEKPGTLALAALTELSDAVVSAPGLHAYIVGEQALPVGARRHLVSRGVDKSLISFCGYWRVGAASPTPKSQQSTAEVAR